MSHPTLDELAALWCGDAPDPDALEDHVFACDACGHAYTRLGAVHEALGQAVLPVVSHAQRERLLARGTRIGFTPVEADIDAYATFAHDLDLLVHVLKADLSRAERVDLAVVGDGVRIDLEDVPFDARTGEVLIACQRHYQHSFPPDPRFDLTIFEGGAQRRASYRVIHQFPV